MAKLIITRPENHRSCGTPPIRRRLGYGVLLLNGRRVATIGPGDAIGLSLSPGFHQVRARFGIFRSQPIDIDATSETRLELVAGPSVRSQNLNLFRRDRRHTTPIT